MKYYIFTVLLIIASILPAFGDEPSLLPEEYSVGEIMRLSPYPPVQESSGKDKTIILTTELGEAYYPVDLRVIYENGAAADYHSEKDDGRINLEYDKKISLVILMQWGNESTGEIINLEPEELEKAQLLSVDGGRLPMVVDLRPFEADTYWIVIESGFSVMGFF